MDFDSQPERLYAGEFRHSIDNKNRITIPSRWRRGRPEEFILLPEATHQFLIVMSPTEFGKTSSAAQANQTVSARDRRIFLRYCIPALSMQARTGKVGSYCRKSFAESLV